MRVQLTDKQRTSLFSQIEQLGLSSQKIAMFAGVSVRLVSDWKKGKYTIPLSAYTAIVEAAKIDPNEIQAKVLEDWWNTSNAGKIGAKARQKRYGQLGTPESRQKGGLVSYIRRRDEAYDIFARKRIEKPEKSRQLAEFIGILIGDGCLTKYQVSVALNSDDDHDYVMFVASLFEKLFGVRSTIANRKTSKCTTVTCSSIELVNYLHGLGTPIGDKIKQGLDIPPWILHDIEFSKACIRGIFDTDGCIFQERHVIKDKQYSYPRISIVSASANLRNSMYQILADLEFDPRIRNNISVNLEKPQDIARYFESIGTSSPKHQERYRSFGGVG